MIIWLASYPKSGNTYVRSFLSAYYYSIQGQFNFDLISNIKQFPDEEFFNKKTNSIDEASDQWMPIQKKIIKNKKIIFFKTHSCLGNYENKPFTTPETTLGAIYVVRDPRNVFNSIKNHFSMNDDAALQMLIDKKRGLITNNKNFSSYSFISSWENHYLSWKKNTTFRRIFVRYEDLLNNKYETFRDIIVFTNALMNKTDGVNKSKLQKAIESTNFDILKTKEVSEKFQESDKGFKKWRGFHKENKNLFFNLGPENDWKKNLDKKIKDKIEINFQIAMKELNYL